MQTGRVNDLGQVVAGREEGVNPRLHARFYCARVQLAEAELENIFEAVRDGS